MCGTALEFRQELLERMHGTQQGARKGERRWITAGNDPVDRRFDRGTGRME